VRRALQGSSASVSPARARPAWAVRGRGSRRCGGRHGAEPRGGYGSRRSRSWRGRGGFRAPGRRPEPTRAAYLELHAGATTSTRSRRPDFKIAALIYALAGLRFDAGAPRPLRRRRPASVALQAVEVVPSAAAAASRLASARWRAATPGAARRRAQGGRARLDSAYWAARCSIAPRRRWRRRAHRRLAVDLELPGRSPSYDPAVPDCPVCVAEYAHGRPELLAATPRAVRTAAL